MSYSAYVIYPAQLRDFVVRLDLESGLISRATRTSMAVFHCLCSGDLPHLRSAVGVWLSASSDVWCCLLPRYLLHVWIPVLDHRLSVRLAARDPHVLGAGRLHHCLYARHPRRHGTPCCRSCVYLSIIQFRSGSPLVETDESNRVHGEYSVYIETLYHAIARV